MSNDALKQMREMQELMDRMSGRHGLSAVSEMQKQMTEMRRLADQLSGRHGLGAVSEMEKQMAEMRRMADQLSGRSILGPMFEMQEQMRHLTGVNQFTEAFRAARWQEDMIKQVTGARGIIGDVFSGKDIRRATLGADLQGLVSAMTGIHERLFQRLLPQDLLQVGAALKLGLIPSLALRDVARATEMARGIAALVVPSSKDLGVLSWANSDDNDELKVMPLRPLPPSYEAAPPPARKLNIKVDVRCSRCGGNLLVRGSSYAVLSDEDVGLDLNIVPWCRCLSDWDGTAEGLIREDAPPPLHIIHGAGEGDGVARADLLLVGGNGEDGDSDDE